METCGMHVLIEIKPEILSPHLTFCYVLDKKFLKRFTASSLIPTKCKIDMSNSWLIVTKALEISKSIKVQPVILSSVTFLKLVIKLYLPLKLDRIDGKIFLVSINLRIFFLEKQVKHINDSDSVDFFLNLRIGMIYQGKLSDKCVS